MKTLIAAFACCIAIGATSGSAADLPERQAASLLSEPPKPAPLQMTVAQAIVLGIVEGVTEYLPVSSTGHLILAQRMMGLGSGMGEDKKIADAYAIVIQGGAILAVLLLYFGRVKSILRGIIGKDPAGQQLAINILAAFLPAAIIGLKFKKEIELHLFKPWPITAAWFVGGVAILAVTYYRRGKAPRAGMTLAELNWKAAMAIGIAQCVAMWPGTSRSLVTIVAGALIGLSLPAAVEFSFLLGLATLGAATLKEAHEHGQTMLDLYGPLPLAAGFIAALISAALAIEWMVRYLNRHGLSIFGYYRIALALVVAVMLYRGVMAA